MKTAPWTAAALSLLMVLSSGCAMSRPWYGKKHVAYAGGAPYLHAGDAVALAPRSEELATDSPAETAGVEQTTNVSARLIQYDATLHVVVQDIAATLDLLKAMAEKAGGYMQQMTQNSITLRIPAAQLNPALARVEALGEVTAREIKGTDVTEEMMDLDIRLRNMEEMRGRLVKLLEKGEKVEDLLQTEKELERVTESLELLKGRIKYLTHAVAMSTLTVHVNSPAPQKELAEVLPFAWVRNLAEDIVLSPASTYAPPRRSRTWLRMELPPAYVKLYDRDGVTRAMSGAGTMLLVQREPNYEGGTRAFWSQIVRRWLTAGRVLAITEERDLKLDSGAAAQAFVAKKTLGRQEYEYRLALVVTRDWIYTFEAWGKAADVAADGEALDKACRSLRIRGE